MHAENLAGKGRADAKAWAKASGALSVVQPDEKQDVTAKADEQNEDYGQVKQARPEQGKKIKAEEAAETVAVQSRAISTKAQ